MVESPCSNEETMFILLAFHLAHISDILTLCQTPYHVLDTGAEVDLDTAVLEVIACEEDKHTG